MAISITLLIQACNFFAAYGVIRFFIFKPLVRIIISEKAHHEALVQAVVQSQVQQEEQEKAIGSLWLSCREQFSAVRPLLEKSVERPVVPETRLMMEEVGAHDDEALIKDVSSKLVQRMCK